MLISCIWHGTSWTFIFWGGLHGIFLLCSIFWTRVKGLAKLSLTLPALAVRWLKIFTTFHLVSFAWIFFRAESLSGALYIVQHLFINMQRPASLFELLPGGWYEWGIALAGILLMEIVHWLQRHHENLRDVIRRQPVVLRWSVYYMLVLIIFMFGKFASTEFIYSRF
jgi:hypothetical protein